MNENLIDNRWKVARNELNNFRTKYNKLNKHTQDKINDIFKIYNIDSNKLYKSISKIDKERLKRALQDIEKNNSYNGYFEFRVKQLIKGNITYKNLIEILLILVYVEEKDSIDSDLNILFRKIALEYYNVGRKDLNKKKKSILPYAIMSMFDTILLDGVIWEDYLDSLILTNMQETEKQCIIKIQQNKNINVYNDLFQNIFSKQRNRLISINDGKYSGGLDKYVTALGNLAYIEASDNNNEKVKFLSDNCENVTDMCSHMDGMIFNTKKKNKFTRLMGDSAKDLTMQNVEVNGLVLGINLPPITNHFHWCHSTITFQIDLPKEKIYNITNPEAFVERIKIKDIDKKLAEYESKIINEPKEHMYVIQPNGNVYHFVGTESNVKATGIDLENSIVTHNHPKEETNYSFSSADRQLFYKYNLKTLRGIDYKYVYELSRIGKCNYDYPTFEDYFNNTNDIYHYDTINYANKNNFGYERWKNDK